MAAQEQRCAVCGQRRVCKIVAVSPYYDRGRPKTTRLVCGGCSPKVDKVQKITTK